MGAELLRMDHRGAGHAQRGRRAGAAQYAHEGRRSRRRAGRQRCAPAVLRRRLPRRTLSADADTAPARHAGAAGDPAAGAGPGAGRRRAGVGWLPCAGAAGGHGGVHAARGRRARRHADGHHVHLGHHRTPQGRDDRARAEPARHRWLGRDHGRARRGPLPDRQSLLPYLRLQGGMACRAVARGHGAAAPGVRCRSRDDARGERAHHGAAGTADALPDAAQRATAARVRPVIAAGCGDRRLGDRAGADRAHAR
ncbi:hypothetical protein D9M69_397550 [compost metagenome]